MKSAIYLGKKKIEIKETPLPCLSDNDVLVKNIYSSICGTDVAVYQYGEHTGHRISVGEEFGHETISKIVAVGKDNTEFTIGERVYPYPLFATGDTKRAGTIGGFSEYIKIPNAKRNYSLYSVPEEIPDRVACLIEPFTIGCRAARRGQPKKHENFVVFGCGTIGLASAIALKYFGIEKVMICDISDFRLSIAQELGFETCNTRSIPFQDKACSYFGTAHSLKGKVADIDGFIDASGAEEILDLFMEQGKIDSRFIMVAVNNKVHDIDLLHLTYSQKSVIGSGGYMPEDVCDVLNIMKSGKWDIEKLITHKFPLEEIEKAIQTASNTEIALNVIIKI